MADKVLVAYATRYGSTKEVAESIAATLRENGLVVEIQPLHDVQSLESFSAVVMGAPLQMFRWHKDALQFLTRFQETLGKLPVAVFALGPFHDVESEWKEVRSELDKELTKFPWFTPVAIAIFGAKYDPATLSFPFSLLPALKQLPASDNRNWDSIREWVIELTGKLQLPQDLTKLKEIL